MCSILPKDISKECDAFVEEYGDLVLKLLEQKLDPEQICTELGLCSQTYMQTLVAAVHLIPSKSSAESGVDFFSFSSASRISTSLWQTLSAFNIYSCRLQCI